MAEYKKSPALNHRSQTLRVPRMFSKLDHQAESKTRKSIAEPRGYELKKRFQTVKFGRQLIKISRF